MLFAAAALFSCRESPEEELIPVMLSYGDGVTVYGENPVYVRAGTDVSFNVEIEKGYVFHSLSEGSYDAEQGKVTLTAVSRRTNVAFYAEKLSYDTDESVVFRFRGGTGDISSHRGNYVNLGTEVTVSSIYADEFFVGWSFGKPYTQGGEIASTERRFKFRVSPDKLYNGNMYIFANYVEKSPNVFFYNVNGGNINVYSVNMTDNEYYSAESQGVLVEVRIEELYSDYAAAISTFWDDGTFRRDGYVLKEYNTKQDGSGEAYSLGSKFCPEGADVLYCIWEKDTPHEEFEYEEYFDPCPVDEEHRLEYAPAWQDEGVVITAYKGASDTVVIPEMIGLKYVVGIAEGAFDGAPMKTLVLNKRLQVVEDGAFRNCTELETVYYPDGLYSISNAAFDEATTRSLTHLYVNATLAPRFSNTGDGAFAVKLSRLLASEGERRIIVVAGSSSYEGLSSSYLESLLQNEYTVINFGTTRTTHGLIYLEAMGHYASEGDVVIYAPENSTYMMGEGELYWKTLRDLEGMNNFFRYIDISNYTNVFSAFADYNQNYRYKRAPHRYEEIVTVSETCDKYGEFQNAKRQSYVGAAGYIDAYYITMNERYKSKYEGTWSSVADQLKNKDYTDPANKTWQSITEPELVARVNGAIAAARLSGAAVLFGFAPADADALVEAARSRESLAAYDRLIASTYDFDGVLGTAESYVFNHKYFYDCAFHLNDYGRTYRTYRLYLDLASYLGAEKTFGLFGVGTNFKGCLFERSSSGTPVYGVDYLADKPKQTEDTTR